MVHFPCTDTEANRSGNSHFCATQRHNQQDPGRVAQEGMVETCAPEVSPVFSQRQVNTGALPHSLPAPADSKHKDCL